MARNSSSERYWDFKLADALNAEMWDKSPRLQREIQTPAELVGKGKVGPQQAMLEPDPDRGIQADTVLPWVPDLVGREAEGQGTVLIYGIAYAGFIKEYSGRKGVLPLADYLNAMNHGDSTTFLASYIEKVVLPDTAYYAQLARLLRAAGVPAARVILSDLCPNSIVMRGESDGRTRVDCNRQPALERAKTYCRYLENPTLAGWTWRRIVESGAERIVALGQIAEHGLLRLFHSHGAEVSAPYAGNRRSPGWVGAYADPLRKLGHWLKEPRSQWTISLPGRTIGLLPVYHPSMMSQFDRGYERTTPALDGFLNS